MPQLRRAGRVPLGGVAVRGLQLLPLDGRSRRRRAAQDRRERRALRRPHAAAARRRRQAPGRALHARRPAAVPLRRRHLERVARAVRRAAPARRSRAGCRKTTAATSSPSTRRCTTPLPPPEQLQAGAPLTVNGQSWTRRLGRRRQADRRRRASCRSGRTSSAASSSPTCASARRGRHPRLHRPGAAGLVGRPLGRRSSGLALTGLREGQREDARRPQRCSARTAARRSRSSWRRRSRSSARSASRWSTCRPGPSAATWRTTRRATAASRGSRSAASARSRSAAPAALPWQVVGYVERCEVRARATTTSRASGASTCSTTAPRASPSSSTPRTAGAGRRRSPARRRPSATASSYDGVLYRKLYDYAGKVTYVLGEFYWRLDARPAHRQHRLRRHRRSGGEAAEPRADRRRGHAARSSGRPARRSPPTTVLTAFGLAPDKRAALQRDALPTTFNGVAARQDLLLDASSSSSSCCCSAAAAAAAAGDCSETAQHLRRRVAGVPELPEQPAERQRLRAAAAARSAAFRAAAGTSSAPRRLDAHHVRSFDRRTRMVGLEWLKPAVDRRIDPLRPDRRRRPLALLRHHRQDHALPPVGRDRREEEHRAGDRRRRDVHRASA